MRKRRKRETLPPETLCQIAQEGGPEGDRAFGELLALMGRRLPVLASKFYAPGLTEADLYQEALYAFRYRAIPCFDPTRGKFPSFAMLAVRRHLMTVLTQSGQRRAQVLNRGTTLSALPAKGDDGEPLDIHNVLPDAKAESPLDQLVREEETARMLRQILARLTPLERRVMDGLRDHGSYKATARALGLSYKVVDNARVRVHRKALDYLKEERDGFAPKEEKETGRGNGDSEERVLGGQRPSNRRRVGERRLDVCRDEGA